MFTLKARRRLEAVWVCAQCCCSDLSHASSTTKQCAIKSLKTTYSASPYVKSCIHCSSGKCSLINMDKNSIWAKVSSCCSKCSGLFSLVSKPLSWCHESTQVVFWCSAPGVKTQTSIISWWCNNGDIHLSCINDIWLGHFCGKILCWFMSATFMFQIL